MRSSSAQRSGPPTSAWPPLCCGEALTARVVDGGGGVDEAVAVPYTRGVMPRDGLVVHDGGDGSYELRCVPKGIGLASLELRLADSSALRGTPLSLTVVPGRAAARCCHAVGDGVRRVAAGCPAELRVVACDASGNRLRRGGLALRALLAPRQPGQEVAVRDAGDGSYVVTYVVPYSGKHTLAVLLGNKAIKGSPFTIEVHPAP